MRILFNTKMHLHFIGIGGIGMSGMAELLYNHGFTISGSDLKISHRTKHLENYKKIKIYYSHESKNINKCDVIVYSSAVKKDNPEIIEGNKNKIPIIKRAELLGQLLRIKDISIAVAGTHGKTTVSSILGNILHQAKKDPTLVIGGIVNKFNNNNITGEGDIIVVEADEFDKSFLSLNPTFSIINNLDLEHLDSYKDLDDLLSSFTEFANSIAFYGKVSINTDSLNINKIKNKINRRLITFGLKNNPDIKAVKILHKQHNTTFEVSIKNKTNNLKIELPCPGRHNVYNTLAAISIALELKIDRNSIIQGIKNYSGVKRRFDIRNINKRTNIIIVDDYAHHPSEIEATINAARNGWNNRIISIFQPHLFSRTRDFAQEFANSLDLSDVNIITDIYPAREKPIKKITSKLIIDNMKNKNLHYIKNKKNIPKIIENIIKENDMILVMGAGDIHTIINSIIIETDAI